jgi:hypothetical protein
MNICIINYICVSADGIFCFFVSFIIKIIQWVLIAIIFSMAKITLHLSPHSISLQSLLTYSMEQSPSWEANQSLQLFKKFPTFLWKLKVLYRTHKCPPRILSQLQPVPTTPSNFLKIHLNIILPSTSGSPQWPLSLRFPHNTLCKPLPYTPHAPPISFFSILPPAQYWVRNTDYSSPHYVTFSILLSPRPN